MKFHEIKEKHGMFFCAHCKKITYAELRYDFTTLELIRIKGTKCDECKKMTNHETFVKDYPQGPE